MTFLVGRRARERSPKSFDAHGSKETTVCEKIASELLECTQFCVAGQVTCSLFLV